MALKPLFREDINGIHHLVLNDGSNALGPRLMELLSSALKDLRESSCPPVLLRSSHRMLFCPGWDLKHLAGAGRTAVADSLSRFNRLVLDLFSYPAPTGAAIGGHAVAGGCLLAMCCDVRIMASGRPRIGLSELNLGVPVPASSLLMLRQRLAPNVIEGLVVGGDGCNAERARNIGVVHRVTDLKRVVSQTERELARLASKPSGAFAATKAFLLGDAWDRMARSQAVENDTFLDCWFSPETQARLAGIVERLKG